MRIPVDLISTVIPEAAPAVRVPQRSQTADALQGLAQTVGNIAGNVRDNELRVAEKAKREAEQREDEAVRSRDTTALLEYDNDVWSLHDGIRNKLSDGSLPYDQSQKAFDDGIADLKGRYQPRLSAKYQQQTGEMTLRTNLRVGREITQASEVTRRSELAGNYGTQMDALLKQSSRPGADIAALNAQAEAITATLGQQAGIPADQLAKRAQDFKDAAWFNQVQQKVDASRQNMGALAALERDLTSDKGEYAGKLDANNRRTLLNQVVGSKLQLQQAAEIAANRAARAAEVRLNTAEKAFTGFQALRDRGGKISPEYVSRVSREVAGTPFAAALGESFNQDQQSSGFGSLSLPQMDATLQAVDTLIAKEGRTPELTKRRDQLETMRDAARKDYGDDPLAAALERGVIDEVPPLDFTDPAAFAASIIGRGVVVQKVAATAGAAISPLQGQEAAAFSRAVAAAPPDRKVALFGALATSTDRGTYLAAMKQVSGDDPLIAAFGAMAGRGVVTDAGGKKGESVARLGFEGLALRNDKTIPKPQDKAIVEEFNANTSSLTFSDSSQRETAMSAAAAVYAAMSQRAGDSSDAINSKRFKKAMDAVTGGTYEHADQRVIKPYGMTDGLFGERLQTRLSEVAKQAKVPIGRLRDLPLVPVPGKSGVYAVSNGTDFLSVNGKRVELDLTKPIADTVNQDYLP